MAVQWSVVLPMALVVVAALLLKDAVQLQQTADALDESRVRTQRAIDAMTAALRRHGVRSAATSAPDTAGGNGPANDAGEPDGNLAAVEDRVLLTPMPPPVAGLHKTLPPGNKVWPQDDPNYGWRPDPTLPLVGVITINAQLGGGGVGLSAKSSWMYPLAYHNKIEYCRKWGYDLIVEDNSIVDQTRDVAWSKIPAMKKWLPKYQWLMWMDMDAFFMRFDMDLEHLLDDDADTIIAKDWNGINMGVYFWRNSPYTMALMDEMWHARRDWWIPWEEQSSLMHIMNPDKNGKKADMHLTHMKFPRQRDMNSYPQQFAYGNQLAEYKDGDFIAHFPNCKAFGDCRTTIEVFGERWIRENNLPPIPKDPPNAVFPPQR